jgi:hypothetical protein
MSIRPRLRPEFLINFQPQKKNKFFQLPVFLFYLNIFLHFFNSGCSLTYKHSTAGWDERESACVSSRVYVNDKTARPSKWMRTHTDWHMLHSAGSQRLVKSTFFFLSLLATEKKGKKKCVTRNTCCAAAALVHSTTWRVMKNILLNRGENNILY